jgi:DNA-binding transcriptional LysR family regulator
MEDRLQKFANLVDAGGFTRGAERMHVSQPALSAAIKKLEKELHAELFAHDTRPIKLTEAGQLAYDTGKTLIAQRTNLKQQLAELDGQKLPLRLGLIDSIAETLFVHNRELDELEQWAHVSLSINNSALLMQSVLQHDLDVAVIVEQPTFSKMIHTEHLGAEPLMVVARSDIAPATQHAAAKGTLPNFLSYNQTSTTHRLVQAAAAQHAIELQPRFYSTSPDIILKLVLAGRGTAALPYLIVREYCENQVLKPITLGNSCVIERRIAAITHTNRHVPNDFLPTCVRLQTQLQALCTQAKTI